MYGMQVVTMEKIRSATWSGDTFMGACTWVLLGLFMFCIYETDQVAKSKNQQPIDSIYSKNIHMVHYQSPAK